MTRRRIAALFSLLACLALLAGCGSSSSKSTSSAAETTPAQSSSSTTVTSTPSSTSTTTSTSSAPSGAPETSDVKVAVEECKRIIQAESKLSSGAKSKLEAACSEAAKGNTGAVTKAAREVCEETIDSSSIPTSAKEAAKADCQKS
jgi:hypothetical protein